MIEACAEIVARDDPRLHATALFAPEPARTRLLALYAFDIELSRATRASTESLIPRMRLQFWRDVVEEAAAGLPAKAHEVAGPLAEMIATNPDLPRSGDLLALIDAHEWMLDLPWTSERWAEWREARYRHLIAAAAHLLADDDTIPPIVPDVAFLADAFALRHAAPMANAGGHVLIPGLIGTDLAALARGDLTKAACDLVAALAAQGLDTLAGARQQRTDRRFVPALLPALWAERTLRAVARDPAAVLGQFDDIDRPFDGLRLVRRALTGRW